MKQRDFINDNRFKKLIDTNTVVQTVTDPNDGYNGFQNYGYSTACNEYYIGGIPYDYYYKRFDNMKRQLRGQDKEVLVLNLGCSGYHNEISFDVKNKTVEEVYKMLQEQGKIGE